MDQQPKIPTLKDAQKPQVKIKGMGAGLTLFDRLKQFKKKDLAFILAGLGTLFMAPLAEHFMMAPENGDASLQQGWGKGGSGGGSFFGTGGSPYEGGGMAPGGAIGGSGDIITPLNVRDPSSLVMGPGGTQQPPAGSAAPAAPPPTAPDRNDDELKDALKGAAARGASAALKKAPLPVPKVALGGSGLRGLGVAAGGSSASGGSLPVGPAAGSIGGGGGGMRQVRATPGFKGVAGARSPTGGTGLDNTKKAGANAGDAFNRAGSAKDGLNAAASETIPTGGQGFGGHGQGGSGANDKPGSGTGPGGSKSVGESLAFLRAKQRQEEELKLEFEKRKLKDPELLLYGIRNDSIKEIAKAMTGSLSKHITGFMDPSPAGAAGGYSCTNGLKFPGAPGGKKCEKDIVKANCFEVDVNGIYIHYGSSPGVSDFQCSPVGKDASGTNPNAENPASTAPAPIGSGGLSNGDIAVMNSLGDVCKKANTEKTNPDAGVKTWAEYLGKKANHLTSAQKALLGDAAPAPCVAAPVAGEKSLKQLQGDAITAMSGAGGDEAAALTGKIKAGAKTDKVTPVPLQEIDDNVRQAREVLDAIKAYVKDQAPANEPIPPLYGPTKPAENKVAVALEGQITTASNNVDRLVSNLENVQTGIEEQLAEFQKMVGPDGAAGQLKVVQTRNEELKKVADKTAPAEGYEGLEVAPAVTIPQAVRNSDETQTQQAAEGARTPIETADTKVDDYRDKLAVQKTKEAEAEPALPADTKPARDAAAETAKTAAEAAKTAANTAVKDAVAKVGDAQTNMTGWADKAKTSLNSLAPMVVARPAPSVASATP